MERLWLNWQCTPESGHADWLLRRLNAYARTLEAGGGGWAAAGGKAEAAHLLANAEALLQATNGGLEVRGGTCQPSAPPHPVEISLDALPGRCRCLAPAWCGRP
jgi:hypothetical protein